MSSEAAACQIVGDSSCALASTAAATTSVAKAAMYRINSLTTQKTLAKRRKGSELGFAAGSKNG